MFCRNGCRQEKVQTQEREAAAERQLVVAQKKCWEIWIIFCRAVVQQADRFFPVELLFVLVVCHLKSSLTPL